MTVYPNKDELIESTTSTDLEPLEETECCCHHRIVEDYIDVDPDKSVKIFYCDTCYITVNETEAHTPLAYTDEPPITLGEPVAFIPLVDN
jgi:hypothetical protein